MERSRHEHARVRDRGAWSTYEDEPGRATATDAVQRADGPVQAIPVQLAPARGWPSSVSEVDDGAARRHGLVPFDPAPPIAAAATVQRRGDGATEQDEAHVHQLANAGFAGGGSALPHLDAIQRSFGRHDVTGVVAHVGGAAEQAARGMGASAYASGNRVAFASAPDLHLAAHEAAHVVQQRGGVSLKSGVGAAGDAYEQHADAVAERVVRGESAEALLDSHIGTSTRAAGSIQLWAREPAEAVQGRVYIQNAIRSARTAENISGVIAALEAPNSSAGLVSVELPNDSAVSIVDLDLAPLLEEARARQRVLGGEASPEEMARGARTVRDAIRDARTVREIDAIHRALVDADYDRAGAAVPVALERRATTETAWVDRRECAPLRAEAQQRRAELARQQDAEADDDVLRRQYEAEQGDARARAADNQRQLDQQQRDEAVDAEGRGPQGNTHTLLEMEFGDDGEITATADPREFADYVDRRVDAVGFGAYLQGYALYLDGSDQPVFVREDLVADPGPARAASTTVHPTYEAARAAAGDGYAFYRGPFGVIAPTVFCDTTTPRVMWGIREARQALARHVVPQLLDIATDIVLGRLIELGEGVLQSLRNRGRRGAGGAPDETDVGSNRSADADGPRRDPGHHEQAADGEPSRRARTSSEGDAPEGIGGSHRDAGDGEPDAPAGTGGEPPNSQPPSRSPNGRRDGTRYATAEDYAHADEVTGYSDSSDLAQRRARWAQRPIQVVAPPQRAPHVRAADEVPLYPQDGFGYACALDLDSGRTAAVATAPRADLTSGARGRGIPLANANGGHLDAARLVRGNGDLQALTDADRGVVGFTAIERGADAVEVRVVSGQANQAIYGRDRPPAPVLAEVQRAAQHLFPGRTVVMSPAGRRP